MTEDVTKKPASRKIALPVQVALLDVLVSERLRELRPEVVNEIAESFKTLGQLQPILVRPVKPSKVTGAHFVLVAGAHRLEAARKLKWKTIAGVMIVGVDAELTEIDVRRLFRENGFVIVRARHRKHWVVHAHPVGREHNITRFVLSTSTHDQNLHRILGGDFKRAAGDRNNERRVT